MALQRYFIQLAYNGGNYHGWQIQPNAMSVQELLNKALSTIFRLPVETTGCGRTDTGVHAKDFYAHFDLELAESVLFMDDGPWVKRLNALLPFDVAVKRLIPVHSGAHARFDATKRSYEYHIHFCKDPFKQGLSWQLHNTPDVDLMNQAAAIIMEYKDFSCFSKSNTQVATNNCKVSHAKWIVKDDTIVFHISADRFLRNMVRAIVGTLMLVGKGALKPDDVRNVIESKSRSKAGESVPACGLYLTEVVYPYPLTPDLIQAQG